MAVAAAAGRRLVACGVAWAMVLAAVPGPLVRRTLAGMVVDAAVTTLTTLAPARGCSLVRAAARRAWQIARLAALAGCACIALGGSPSLGTAVLSLLMGAHVAAAGEDAMYTVLATTGPEVLPAQASLACTWASATVVPLDWEAWFQVWPIPAAMGCAGGSWAALLFLCTAGIAPNPPRPKRDADTRARGQPSWPR